MKLVDVPDSKSGGLSQAVWVRLPPPAKKRMCPKGGEPKRKLGARKMNHMLRSRLPGKIIIKGIAADWVTACLSISSPQKCTAPEQLEPILYRTRLGIDGKKNRPLSPF